MGRGSYPNSSGIVQLDGAIMRGQDCAVGAVCALEGYVLHRNLKHVKAAYQQSPPVE